MIRFSPLLALAVVLTSATAWAGPSTRWQVTPHRDAFLSGGAPHIDLFVWPNDRNGSLPPRFRLSSVHSLGSDRGAWVEGDALPPPAEGRRLDVTLVLDLGGIDSDMDAVRAAAGEIAAAVRNGPADSTLRVLTFPYRGDGRGPGGNMAALGSALRFDPSANDPPHLTDPAAWSVTPARIPDASRGWYADLGGVLIEAIDSMNMSVPKDAGPPPVRAVFYIASSSTYVGIPSEVVAASRRAGNVPVFALFFRTTATATAGIAGEMRVPTVYTGFEFHHVVTAATGGWVLSGDLHAGADSQVAGGQFRGGFGRRRAVIPPQLGPLREFLKSTVDHLARPCLIRAELPCISATPGANGVVSFSLRLGSGSDLEPVTPIGGCDLGGGGSTLMCVHPGVEYSQPSPVVDRVGVWSSDVKVAEATAEDLTLDRYLLGGAMVVEVRGKNFCGDAELGALVAEHSGVASLPRTFVEAPAPRGAEVLPESAQRFFAVYNLDDSTRRLALDMQLRGDPLRVLPGSRVRVSALDFGGGRWSTGWLVSFVMLLGVVGAGAGALRTLGRRARPAR